MRNPQRPRVEFQPSYLVQELLAHYEQKWPALSQPARIEKLVIHGQAIEQFQDFQLPPFSGNNRYRWRKGGKQ